MRDVLMSWSVRASLDLSQRRIESFLWEIRTGRRIVRRVDE